SAEYVPWFLRHDDQIERFRIPVDEYVRRSEENLAEFEEMERRLAAGEELEIEPTSELASEIVRSIETGSPHEVYGNVRNDGLIAAQTRTSISPGLRSSGVDRASIASRAPAAASDEATM